MLGSQGAEHGVKRPVTNAIGSIASERSTFSQGPREAKVTATP